MINFISQLRSKEILKEKKLPKQVNQFEFYQNDIEKWNERHSFNKPNRPREKSPFNTLDVAINGNSGVVSFIGYYSLKK